MVLKEYKWICPLCNDEFTYHGKIELRMKRNDISHHNHVIHKAYFDKLRKDMLIRQLAIQNAEIEKE